MLMKKWCVLPVVLFAFLLVSGCARTEEMTLEEIDALLASGENELLSRTVSKPWRGEAFVPGVHGGVWNASVSADPKSFNLLVAERDGVDRRDRGAPARRPPRLQLRDP